jgi:hypothetical protein
VESTTPSGVVAARAKDRESRLPNPRAAAGRRVPIVGTGTVGADRSPRSRLERRPRRAHDRRAAPRAQNTAVAHVEPAAPLAAPGTSRGASWSKTPRPPARTSENAKSKAGSRPTTVSRSPVCFGPSASPAPGPGGTRDTIVPRPVGPTSARAASGCTSGASPRPVETGRAVAQSAVAQNSPGGDSSSSSNSTSVSST